MEKKNMNHGTRIQCMSPIKHPFDKQFYIEAYPVKSRALQPYEHEEERVMTM